MAMFQGSAHTLSPQSATVEGPSSEACPPVVWMYPFLTQQIHAPSLICPFVVSGFLIISHHWMSHDPHTIKATFPSPGSALPRALFHLVSVLNSQPELAHLNLDLFFQNFLGTKVGERLPLVSGAICAHWATKTSLFLRALSHLGFLSHVAFFFLPQSHSHLWVFSLSLYNCGFSGVLH